MIGFNLNFTCRIILGGGITTVSKESTPKIQSPLGELRISLMERFSPGNFWDRFNWSFDNALRDWPRILVPIVLRFCGSNLI